MLLGLDPGSLTRPLGARAFLEGEQCYESNRLVRYIVHFHGCASARRNTGKTIDRWRKAARSGEAEGVSWLQARRNGQGDEALGGRMHVAGAKNRYASRTVESDVHPRYDGRGRSEGSAVALRSCAIYSITTNQAAIIGLFRVINRYVGNLPLMPGSSGDVR